MRQPSLIARARVSASPSAAGSACQEMHEPISHHMTGIRSWSPITARPVISARAAASASARAAACLSAGAGLGAGISLSAGIYVSAGGSLSAGAGLGEGISRGEGFWPGVADAVRSGVGIAGRVGAAVVPELGEPAVRLEPAVLPEPAGVLRLDLDLHVGPPVVASGVRRAAAGDLPRGQARALRYGRPLPACHSAAARIANTSGTITTFFLDHPHWRPNGVELGKEG